MLETGTNRQTVQSLGWLNQQQRSLRGKSWGLGAHGDGGELPEILEKHVQMWLLVVEFIGGRG